MCVGPDPLPALVLTMRPELEERRSSGGKRCPGPTGWGQLSIRPLHFPSLGLRSSTFLTFSRDLVFPGSWGSSAFPLTAHFSCSQLTWGVHASAAFQVPLSLSWGQAAAPYIHPNPADAAPVSTQLRASAPRAGPCGCACRLVGTRVQKAQVLWLPPVEPVMVCAGTQGAGHSLHLLAILFLSVPKGSAAPWPHLGLAELCFSQLNSLPPPRQVFLHYPCLCCAPHLLQPSSAADGHRWTC